VANKKIKELVSGYEGWGPDLYDDGVITYKAPAKSDFVKAFRKLERQLGIDTERVKKRGKADIICNYSDDLIDGKYAGLCSYRRDKRGREYNVLEVVEDRWYSQSTVVHEIGHALGMDHPADHSRTDTIMSYGAPGDLPWFTRLDRQVLRYLY
jgi:hypothetical protein